MLIQPSQNGEPIVQILRLEKPFNAPESWVATSNSSPDSHSSPFMPSSSTLSPPKYQYEPGTLAEDRTLTNAEAKKYVKPPIYYNPNTQEAANSVFQLAVLGGIDAITFGKEGIDPKYINSNLGKASYYAGKGVVNAFLGYGLGGLVGEGADALSMALRGTGIGSRVVSLVTRIPKAPLRGIAKGLIVGLEAAKGIAMREKGASWRDVIGSTVVDFAGLAAFNKGFEDAALTKVVTRENRFLEGQVRQVDLYKRGKLVRSVKTIEKTLPNGDIMIGRGVYAPDQGTVIRINVNGQRFVDMELVNDYKSSKLPFRKLPFRQTGVRGLKFWKRSYGGSTSFYLYDPPRAVVRNGLKMEVAGIRSVMEELKPRPLLSPPPSPESIMFLGGIGVELLNRQKGITLGQKQKTLSLNVQVGEIGQKQRTKVGLGVRTLREVRLSRRGALLAMRPKKARTTRTKTKSLLNIKPPKPPKLASAFPRFFRKSERQKLKRKKKKKKGNKGFQVLGEVDLLTQDILEQEGVVEYSINTKKFRRLWDSGLIWGGEGLDLVKSVKKAKRGELL